MYMIYVGHAFVTPILCWLIGNGLWTVIIVLSAPYVFLGMYIKLYTVKSWKSEEKIGYVQSDTCNYPEDYLIFSFSWPKCTLLQQILCNQFQKLRFQWY